MALKLKKNITSSVSQPISAGKNIESDGITVRQRVQDYKSKGLNVCVGVGGLSSPLEVGADGVEKASAKLAGLLGDLGCDVVDLGPIGTPDKAVAAGKKLAEAHVHAVALAATSWYEDYLVVDLQEECQLPVLLWSLPGVETGALCGNQQLGCEFKQLGVSFEAIHGYLVQADLLNRAMRFLRAASLKYRLRRSKVGLGGHHVPGMTEAAVNEIALKREIGCRIVPFELSDLKTKAQAVSEEQAGQIWRQIVERVSSCKVSDDEGIDSARTYVALRKIVEEQRMDALAIGCYPHLMGRVCLAASLLADDGIPFGCEGDGNTVVAQLILSLLSGAPTHNADWLEPLEDGTVVFSHCGNGSLSLADNAKDITLEPVRLMKYGVCVLFATRPGPVTILNLVPSGDGYQCAMLTGEAVSTDMVFPGNPLRVRFPHDPSHLINWIATQGIGHHWAACYGDFSSEIRHWAAMSGSKLRLLTP